MVKHAELMARAVEILEERGVEATYRDNYSGRGMFGRACPAIVTSAPMAEVVVAYTMAAVEQGAGDEEFVIDDALDLAMEHAPRRCDSMGLDKVFY